MQKRPVGEQVSTILNYSSLRIHYRYIENMFFGGGWGEALVLKIDKVHLQLYSRQRVKYTDWEQKQGFPVL